MSRQLTLPAINNAIREVCCTLEERSMRSATWASMAEDDLWRELVACILGSRVRFEVAHSALNRMERMGLFSESRRSADFERYELDVIDALSGMASNEAGRYPFFRVRAKQVRRSAEQVYGQRCTLKSYLGGCADLRETRRRLAMEVPGLGPKQASLFLRNVGYASDVAILDVHVLTYMCWAGLVSRPIKSIPTVRKYEALEEAFVEHAQSLGYPPDHFDLAVWVVVKVAKEEGQRWP